MQHLEHWDFHKMDWKLQAQSRISSNWAPAANSQMCFEKGTELVCSSKLFSSVRQNEEIAEACKMGLCLAMQNSLSPYIMND